MIQITGDIAPFAKGLIAAQKAYKTVEKTGTNPQFKSKYATLDDLFTALLPALNNNGIALMQSAEFDGDMVSVTTVLLHESGTTVSSKLSMRPTATTPQAIGSCQTYARRYSLQSLAGCNGEADDDGNAASEGKERPKPARYINQAQEDTLRDLALDVGADLLKFCAYLKIEKLALLPEDRFQDAIAALEAKRGA